MLDGPNADWLRDTLERHEGKIDSIKKTLDGGSEPDRGLIYQHQDTRHRVSTLEAERDRTRQVMRLGIASVCTGVVTLIVAFAKSLFLFIKTGTFSSS